MTARPEPAALQSHGSSRLGDVPGLPRYVLAPWIDAEALVSAPPIELDDVAQFRTGTPVGAKHALGLTIGNDGEALKRLATDMAQVEPDDVFVIEDNFEALITDWSSPS
jgi:hypothetical protein